jgi:hypothetical protein
MPGRSWRKERPEREGDTCFAAELYVVQKFGEVTDCLGSSQITLWVQGPGRWSATVGKMV